jgi:hypothetical protein
MKWIKGNLGEMRIELKLEAKSVKHRLYHLNPCVKEKVKKEIYRMLAVEIIFPLDEVEWISPIVIQRKKGIDDIRVYVDYMSLNSTCVNNPFPYSF